MGVSLISINVVLYGLTIYYSSATVLSQSLPIASLVQVAWPEPINLIAEAYYDPGNADDDDMTTRIIICNL